MGEIGGAWLGIVRELEQKLRALDPDATVSPSIGDSGLLRLRVHIRAEHRRAARETCRRHERRAGAVCEDCGSEMQSAVQAGPVIGVLCPDCRR